MTDATGRASELARHTRDAARGHPVAAALIGVALGYLVYRMATSNAGGRSRHESAGSWPEEEVDYGEYGSTGRSSLMREARRNPLPAALIAFGLGWLVRNVRHAGQPHWDEPAQGAEAHGAEGEHAGWAGFGNVAWSGTAHEMAGAARRRIRSTGHALSRRSGQIGRMMREHPLPFGVAALAAGAAVGLSVPGTEAEKELLGEARERIVERAREARDTVIERAREVTGTGESRAEPPPPA
ncbi:MAG TPA: hypothetical protein VF198_18080 [Vicinamibacterales bacterium]